MIANTRHTLLAFLIVFVATLSLRAQSIPFFNEGASELVLMEYDIGDRSHCTLTQADFNAECVRCIGIPQALIHFNNNTSDVYLKEEGIKRIRLYILDDLKGIDTICRFELEFRGQSTSDGDPIGHYYFSINKIPQDHLSKDERDQLAAGIYNFYRNSDMDVLPDEQSTLLRMLIDKAAAMGNPESLFTQGNCFYSGDSTHQRSVEQAKHYWLLAFEGGCTEAAFRLLNNALDNEHFVEAAALMRQMSQRPLGRSFRDFDERLSFLKGAIMGHLQVSSDWRNNPFHRAFYDVVIAGFNRETGRVKKRNTRNPNFNPWPPQDELDARSFVPYVLSDPSLDENERIRLIVPLINEYHNQTPLSDSGKWQQDCFDEGVLRFIREWVLPVNAEESDPEGALRLIQLIPEESAVWIEAQLTLADYIYNQNIPNAEDAPVPKALLSEVAQKSPEELEALKASVQELNISPGSPEDKSYTMAYKMVKPYHEAVLVREGLTPRNKRTEKMSMYFYQNRILFAYRKILKTKETLAWVSNSEGLRMHGN